MTAKQSAIEDIKNDLKAQGRCFIAFRRNLNPTMRKLVSCHIREQKNLNNPFKTSIGTKRQLIAHCYFNAGTVKLTNYTKYYEKQ